MSETTDNTDLIVELRRDGERALSPNLQGLLNRAATALEQAELDLVEVRNQIVRSGRVNVDLHRVCSEAQQKLTVQAATIEAVRAWGIIADAKNFTRYTSNPRWALDRITAVLTANPEGHEMTETTVSAALIAAARKRADELIEESHGLDGESAGNSALDSDAELFVALAADLAQSERDLVEVRNQIVRSGRVNVDLHRVCSEAQQKLTVQAAVTLARAVMFDSDAPDAREQIIAVLTTPKEGTP